MAAPEGLYELTADADNVPEGLHLVAGLTGFADAGGAVSQFTTYLGDILESHPVAEFDADILLDYRARRPIITFDQDHLTDFQPARLTLALAADELGRPFLLLTGFEPDFQWERFAQAVLTIVDRFRVTSTTWVHAIPMPVPHTRAIRVTVSGNRDDLTETMSVWKPRTQVPATALHLVEFRLQERGDPVVGFVLLVPHYLADTEYPAAAISAVESISASTGLIFPTEALRQQDRDFVARVEQQVSENSELGSLVTTLEERHDNYMEGTTLRSPLTDVDGEVPSADEIAAELERFLAFRRDRDDDASKGR